MAPERESATSKRSGQIAATAVASATGTKAAVKQSKPQTLGTTAAKATSKADTAGIDEEASAKAKTAKAAGSGAGNQVAGAGEASRLHEGLEWEYCGLRPVKLGPAAVPPEPGEDDPLYVGADTFAYDQELDLLTLTGDVEMIQGSRYIGADKVTYDRGSTDLVAKGNTFLANPGVRLVADEAQVNLESDKGSLNDVEYRLTGKMNARGTADRAELVQPELTRYENIVYSACRPGQKAWSLAAEELVLDQSTGRGVARNAKLRVRDVPVLYTPYLSFPIDDRRKSGILVPSVGHSEDNGIDVTVPYYWNIAPNMDATFFPRYMSNRGAMLGTEFRYMLPRQEAELYGEVIPRDSRFEGTGSRWAFRIDHKARFSPRWSSEVIFNEVSDDEYLEDFGNNLELTSTRNIERRGDLVYRGNGFRLITRLQDFQTVDDSIAPIDRPYGRIPRVLLTTNRFRLDPGIQLGLTGEYNYFKHSDKVHGHRSALQPYAVWPLRKSYGHLTPKLNLYLASYGLKEQAPDKRDHPTYAIPSFDLDGELVFERKIQWFDHESLQTLEPRIYYLYTPFKDQDDQPVFDSSELSFSYYSLFRQNRFTGRDRIGDANQLTLGLTSRTLSMESGRELLRASVGQILYFRNRDVQISGPAEDSSSSSIAGELTARLLQDWTGRASFEWDPNQDEDRSRKRALELHYQTRDDRLLNLVYRFDLGTSEATRYEDTDLSFRLPVNRQLQLVGRWYYSMLNSETVEALAGVEYGQCCWRVRLLGRHLKNKPDSAGSNTFMVQMELAGLGSIGQRVDKFLERGIYGYHAD
jgi:LPS-assembly protein